MKSHLPDANAGAIRWPAVTLSQGILRVTQALDTTATSVGLRNRAFDHMLLIDSEGKEYRVCGAERMRMLLPRGSHLISDLLGILSGNPRFVVRLKLSDERPRFLSASQLKEMILNLGTLQPATSPAPDVGDLRRDIVEATTISDVFAALGRYGFK